MKKEILELVVLGLQAKERLSTENIVNALASLSEEQQHQWIETMLPNRQPVSDDNPQTGSKQFDSYESESKTDQVNDNDLCEEMCTLKVMPQSDASKFKIAKYLHEELNYSVSDSKNLVYYNATFELPIPFYKAPQITDELTLLKCLVKRM